MTTRKRDLTEAQLAAKLRKLGWTPQGFWGYWQGPSGIAVSAANYARRRDALRDMRRIDRQHAAKRAEVRS